MATDKTCDIIFPGDIQRPETSIQIIKDLALDLYGLTMTKITEHNSYVDRNYWIDVETTYKNSYIKELWPHGYLMKVLNSTDSKSRHYEAEHEVQALYASKNIACPQPVLTINGNDATAIVICNDGKFIKLNCENNIRTSGMHIVRLFTFIPGQILHSVSYTPQIIFNVGELIGRIFNVLQGYSHSELDNFVCFWNLKDVPILHDYLHVIKEPEKKELFEDVIREIEDSLLNNLHKCTPGVIHGDINEQNILVRPVKNSKDPEYEVHGIVDFGHLQDTYIIFDVAVACMYTMVESKIIDPLLIPAYILAGLDKYYKLNEIELKLLKVLISGRFSQSMVIGANVHAKNPANEYAIVTAKHSWSVLKRLWEIPNVQLCEIWKETKEKILQIVNEDGNSSMGPLKFFDKQHLIEK